MKIRFVAVAVAMWCSSSIAAAPWVLDNETSRLSFVSIKAEHVAEVHRFDSLSGIVTPAGRVSIAIELASVDTLIPIRDERMRELLFETQTFPTAKLTSTVDAKQIEGLAAGSVLPVSAEVVLELRGQRLPLTADLLVVKLSDHRILVVCRQPVVVNAGSLDLVDGVERLREIAGLPSISRAVPVSAVLAFDRVDE